MKCLYFAGVTALKTVDTYNKWAKGKMLSKDVIIHSHIIQPAGEFTGALVIVVFFDEKLHEDWIGKGHTKDDMVEQHIAGVESMQEVAA